MANSAALVDAIAGGDDMGELEELDEMPGEGGGEPDMARDLAGNVVDAIAEDDREGAIDALLALLGM
jgi:hypothetical protein